METNLTENKMKSPFQVILLVKIAFETNNFCHFLIRWPQTTIPTFKIAASQCLQKVRTGEQICLVRLVLLLYYSSHSDAAPKCANMYLIYLEERMKLSRPLSAREAVVHLFAFEYFQDGLIVVVANTVST